jgi:YVTN family beta-propeller protein
VIAAVAVVLVVAAALGAFVLLSGSGSGLSTVSPNSLGVIDAKSNKLVGEVTVGVAPQAVVTGAGGVWVANTDDKTLMRIDPADTTARPKTIPVADYPSDLAIGSGSVLVALGALAEIQAVNPEQNDAASPFSALGQGQSCGPPRASLTYGGGYAWFVCEVGQVGRANVRSATAASIGLDLLVSSSAVLPEFSDVAFGLGRLWIVNRAANQVVEVDPLTSQKQREITVGQKPEAIAVGSGALWVANFGDDTVTRIAIPGPGQTPTLTTIDVGDGPSDVTVGENGVWVANRLGGTVTRIDPESGDVVATIDVGNAPERVAAGEGSVWVTVRAPETGS